jgi:hypothetical protein
VLLNEVQKQYHRAQAEAKVITGQEDKIETQQQIESLPVQVGHHTEELQQRMARLESLMTDDWARTGGNAVTTSLRQGCQRRPKDRIEVLPASSLHCAFGGFLGQWALVAEIRQRGDYVLLDRRNRDHRLGPGKCVQLVT